MNNRNYIKVTKGMVDAKLDVFIYENDGFKIAYAPALDLMGYGRTIEDAKASFEIVAEDFFETTIRLGTLRRYLEEHGLEQRLSPPPHRRHELDYHRTLIAGLDPRSPKDPWDYKA